MAKQRHEAGDERIATMNVCNVPMHPAAFGTGGGPDLSADDWAMIEKVRTPSSSSIAGMKVGARRNLAEGIAQAFGQRIRALPLNRGCQIVVAGKFARWMVEALPSEIVEAPLLVPHASCNQWNVTNQAKSDLLKVQKLFASAVP